MAVLGYVVAGLILYAVSCVAGLSNKPGIQTQSYRLGALSMAMMALAIGRYFFGP